MERDSVVHGGMDQPLSVYKSHNICSNTNRILYASNSKGLLKAPPLSLLQSPPLPHRSSSCPAPATKRNTQKKSTTSYSTSKNNNPKKTPPKFRPETAALPRRVDNSVIKDRVDMLLGSVVFTISPPPPSSLPLPTFSLRPKLTCNPAATDDLRRLLRLL